MVRREFEIKNNFLHFPIFTGEAHLGNYVKIFANGCLKREIFLSLAKSKEKAEFYCPLDVSGYGTKITLICDDEGVSEDFFDGVINGKNPREETKLYPDLYKEEVRQQVHFSAARGWMNDPNGLFYQDGVFNMYFQHNAFANHHFGGPNCSWGHAKSFDGVHFEEQGDKIVTFDTKFFIASGSAIVDKYNLAGFGENAIIAYCTRHYAEQFCGRVPATSGGGQDLYYSLDGGNTFTPYEKNPVISSPDGLNWRDPKIIQLNEKTFALAVYETFEDKNCISIYKSKNGKEWEFCSRNFDFYECPDLCKIRVKNESEDVWVLYGANGLYNIGAFEDFIFTPVGDGGFVDYGVCLYAGQTFNNYGDGEKRLYTAWLCDWDHDGWKFSENEPMRKFGFSQSMALFTELTVVKTKKGYKLLRAPIKALETLRGEKKKIDTLLALPMSAPCEVCFTLKKGQDAKVRIDDVGFDYIGNEHKFISTTNKESDILCEDDICVRVIVDRRTVEIFVANESVLSFNGEKKTLNVETEYVLGGEYYTLKSIWEK